MPKPGEVKIFNALTINPSGLTYKELREITGLSNTALAQYLKAMQQTGMLRKDYERRRYLLASVFLPMKDFANLWQKTMKVSAVNFVRVALEIRKIKSKEERTVAMQRFLRASFHMLTLFLWKILGESIAEYGSDIEKLKDQELAVKRSMIINEAIQNWVLGIADSLAAAMVLNIDVLDDAGEPVFQDVLKQVNNNIKQLGKFVDLRRE